jgi:hypothetical protein
MSTPTEDRQFLLMCAVAVWMILRIVATVLGLAPWSWWIVVAMCCSAWAFVAWGHLEDANINQ